MSENSDPNLADYVHLEKIRTALNDGCAAVMVGSGFSRNAVNGDQMPNWTELGRKLFPDEPCPSPADIPRIAERYVALHGRHALDALIRKNILDQGKTRPSDLHKELLQLNWRDVFTTNYDTLLERAYFEDQDSGDSKIEEHYFPVCTIKDIPGSRERFKRRIVKLHGSLPSHRPFIFTEEDYRTYPQKFAPFVTMVRQSLMENVFCLMGFSGDDPNFRAWTGWVRDQLGEMQPKIYLITVDDLPLGQKRLLEDRNIICVDISALGKLGREPHKECYAKLITFLSQKPESSDDWAYVPRDSWLEQSGDPASPEQKKKLLQAMRKQRQAYPGWIFPPLDISKWLWEFCERHYYFLDEKSSLLGEQRILSEILVLREKLWPRWLVGIPCSPEFVQYGLGVLQSSQPLLPIENIVFPENSPWSEIQVSIQDVIESWQEVACILLSIARRDWESEYYEKILQLLCSVPKGFLSPDICSWIAYLEVLRHMERLEPDAARDKLKKWTLDPNDNSFWPVRYAMLCAEIYDSDTDFEKAREQLLNALKNIRKRIQVEGEVEHLLSYEQWVSHYFKMLNLFRKSDGFVKDLPSRSSGGNSTYANDSTSFKGEESRRSLDLGWGDNDIGQQSLSVADKRQRKFKYMPWYPSIIFEDMEIYLLNMPNILPRKTTYVSFDLGKRSVKINLRFRNHNIRYIFLLSPAYSLLSLIDHVCTILSIRHMGSISSKMFVNATALFCKYGMGGSEACLGIALRSASSNFMEDGQPLFSRRSVALLNDKTVALLVHNCLKILSSRFSSDTGKMAPAVFQPYINFTLELLGRLSPRVRKETHQQLLEVVMDWYKNPRIVTDGSCNFEPLFERVVQSVSYKELASSLASLLTLPLFVSPQPRHNGEYFDMAPDPVMALPDRWPVPLRHLLSDVGADKWDEVAKHSIDEITREKLSVNYRDQVLAYHWGKLTWLSAQGVLSDTWKQKVWTMLWDKNTDIPWPEIPWKHIWVPLVFASENQVDDIWKMYRTYILGKLSEIKDNIDEIYSIFCMDIELRNRLIKNDDDELRIALLEALKSSMIKKPPQRHYNNIFDTYKDEQEKWRQVLWLLCFICGPRLAVLQDRCPWLHEHLRQFYDSCQKMEVYCLRLELVMASLGMEGFSREILLRHIEDTLFTEGGDKIYEAGIALLAWLAYFPDLTPPPPIELLARAFVMRQPFNQKLCAVLVERQKYVKEPFSKEELDYILPALERYAQTLAYDYRDNSDDAPWGPPLRLELPEERWWCGQLVVALWQSNPEIHKNETIQRWVEIMRNDPLAEMHRLVEIIDAAPTS